MGNDFGGRPRLGEKERHGNETACRQTAKSSMKANELQQRMTRAQEGQWPARLHIRLGSLER
jgi:hypothetical protein